MRKNIEWQRELSLPCPSMFAVAPVSVSPVVFESAFSTALAPKTD